MHYANRPANHVVIFNSNPSKKILQIAAELAVAISANEDGEICISGPTVMMGYLNNEAETNQVLRYHEDGRLWLHTGDVGCMDSDGVVFYKQRMKRIIEDKKLEK